MTNFPIFLDTPGFEIQTRIKLQNLIDQISDQLTDRYDFHVMTVNHYKLPIIYWVTIQTMDKSWIIINHYQGTLFYLSSSVVDIPASEMKQSFTSIVLNYLDKPCGYIDLHDTQHLASLITRTT